MTLADLYPYLVAAHVTAVAILVGCVLAQLRLVRAIEGDPKETQRAALLALLRLDRAVATPALLAVWILGVWLAVSAGWLPSAWLMVKLALVVAVSALHGVQSGRMRRFLRDGAPAKGAPGAELGIVAATLAIAILAVVKPF